MKTFERPNALKMCIQSIRHVFPKMEIVVVDDSARPYTKEITKSNSGIKVIELPFNVGMSVGRNTGLDVIETPNFILLDDDMKLPPKAAINKLLSYVHNGFDIAAGVQKNMPSRKRFAWYGDFSKHGRSVFLNLYPDVPFTRKCHCVPQCFVANTNIVRDLRWDERFKIAPEHADFFWRAFVRNLKVIHCHDVEFLHFHSVFRSNLKYESFRHKPSGFNYLLETMDADEFIIVLPNKYIRYDAKGTKTVKTVNNVNQNGKHNVKRK